MFYTGFDQARLFVKSKNQRGTMDEGQTTPRRIKKRIPQGHLHS